SGEIVNGAVNVNVTADRWPAPEALADRVSGWLSFTGSVGGSVEAPAVQGRVRGGSLKVGSWSIDDPAGDVSVTRELVRVDRLRGVGAGDGLYELTGVIRSWMEEPVLDLDVSVEGASLSALLRHGGWRLPALLFDGQVSG